MKLIVGLGNPGEKYDGTRHNAGRMLVERLAAESGARAEKNKRLKAFTAQTEIEGQPVCLAYPDSFMNISGDAVKKLAVHYEINADKDLVIVIDDVALPLGKIRLRASGSDGGHNGLKSVIEMLGTGEFARLRLGVGPEGPVEEDLSDFVLGRFPKSDKNVVEKMMDRGIEACRLWVSQPIQNVMSVINAHQEIS